MKHIIFVFLFILSQGAWAAEIGLIVNLMGPEGYGDRQWDNYYVHEFLKQGRENLKFKIINAESAEELDAKLQADPEIQQSNIKVLHVSAHGKSIEYVHTDGSSHFEIGVKNLGNIYFDEEIKEGFKSILGRFSDHALIVFDSCELLKAGTLDAKKSILLKVAHAFDLKSGQVYLNKTNGSSKIIAHGSTPPFAKEGHPAVKFWRLFQYLFSNNPYLKGIADALKWEDLIYDLYFYNKGYSLILDSTGKNTMIEDTYWNALKSTNP